MEEREEEDCYCQAPEEGEEEEEEEQEEEAEGSPDCGEAAYLPLAVHLLINGILYAKTHTQFHRCTRRDNTEQRQQKGGKGGRKREGNLNNSFISNDEAERRLFASVTQR